MRVGLFEVPDQKAALRELVKIVERSTVDPKIRNAALAITHDCDSRDDECEIRAVFEAITKGTDAVEGMERGVKYVSDPIWADFFTVPARLLKQLAAGYNGEDCLPGDTLLLGAGFKPFPIANAKVGDLVMGDGKWTRITKVWNKGVQDLLEFKLNNGCVLRCTADHKVFVVPKRNGRAGPRSEAVEVRAGDVRPGDDLLTIESLPEGRESLETERAWLLGTHVADGWIGYSDADGRPLRVGISGKDGWRKEGQKTRAEMFCEREGLHSNWQPKYLSISNEPLAQWLAACGRTAISKHLPSIDFDRPTIAAIMSGLVADTDVRDDVFGTISPELALQYRLLLRMSGVSAHLKRVDDHGGFGKNPIYRVAPRHKHANGMDVRPHARVQSISEGGAEETFDIEVEGHRFYLPETDLIVHNCDGHSMFAAALLGSLGFTVGLQIWGEKKGEYSHVYSVIGYPKIGWAKGGDIIALDTTVEGVEPGWAPPGGYTLTAMSTGGS